MDRSDLYNKVLGAFIGVAYGDAMGMPVEFWTKEKITRRFGWIDSFLDAPEDNVISHGLKAGQVTDDTYMTFLISETLIEDKGKVDPFSIVKNMLKWSDLNSAKIKSLFGPSTKKALELISNGAPIEEAGKDGLTNGSAMRIIPVGIISNWKEIDILVENVRLSCLPTHNTRHAISAASAIASAVSCSIYGDGSLEGIIEAAKSAALKGMKFGYDTVGASVEKRISMAVDITKDLDDDIKFLSEIYNAIGTGLAVSESIPASLALFLRSNGDPLRCARLSANLGGDTDTIGAMACGICGALRGIKAFSEEDIEMLSKVNNLDFVGLAEKFLKIL
ncbi:MAG: ADP-ribosylglycohydrolase family protein [Bacteroidota bacterium]|nr:ADP-ribosylglycohydrolase family protein [Bacteroidota bacterium]